MGFFSHDSNEAQQAQQANDQDNQPTWTGELIGGATAFGAARAYENHCAANGNPGSHAEAKELMAGFAGVEADRLIQTSGMNEYDAIEARKNAVSQSQDTLSPDNYNNY